MPGTPNDDTIYGTSDAEIIHGLAGNDTISGYDGDDQIYGDEGDDAITLGGNGMHVGQYAPVFTGTMLGDGGIGRDTIIIQTNASNVTALGADGDDIIRLEGIGGVTANGGAGNDLIDVRLIGAGVFTLGAGADTVLLANPYFATGFSITIADYVQGEDRLSMYLMQMLSGWNSATNPFTGGFLKLVQSGADTVLQIDRDGSAGNSYSFTTLVTFQNVSVAAITDIDLYPVNGGARIFNGTAGNDTINANGQINGLGGNDTITSGSADGDVLHGNDGDDSLRKSGPGSAELYGDAGNDQLTVGLDYFRSTDTMLLDGGADDDAIFVNESNIADFDIASGRTHSLRTTVRGGTGNDVILVATSGASTIDAGSGNDFVSDFVNMYGAFRSGAVAEAYTITLGAGRDTLQLRGGNDIPVHVVTDFNPAEDRLTLALGLSSYTGFLRLVQSGADTILQYDSDGGGDLFVDFVRFSNVAASSFTELAGFRVDGSGTVDYEITGSNISYTINEQLIGGGGNDMIRGLDGADFIYGQAGNDAIFGGNGADFLFGEAGNDTLYGDDGNDTLDGGTGNDTFIGGAGSDTLSDYFGGDDTYILDDADTIAEGRGAGIDTVVLRYAPTSYTLGADLENLTVMGATEARGNGLDNVLTGDGAANTLRGNGGNDTLIGRGGGDTLSGGLGNDIYRGTLADMAGDVLTDLAIGDRINVTDAAHASFSYARNGTALSFGGTTMDIGSANVRLVLAGSASSGTDLIAANRYTGLADFDGNGHSDLLWRNTGGAFSTWQVSGNVAGNQLQVNSTFVDGVGTNWRVQETFDFNGDGRSDILWRNANTGDFSVWNGQANGWTPNSFYFSGVGTDWRIAGVGDLNGDGRDDIVWRQSGGAFSTWQSTGTGFNVNVTFDTSVSSQWQIVGLADFNGDGRDDLMWRNQSTGQFSEWWSTGSGFTANNYFDSSVNTSWHIDALADFNGDGRDDILWRHDGDGAFSIWQSTGAGFTPNTYFNAGVAPVWQVVEAGDFNDDGRADILWRNTASGEFSTWQSNGNGFDANVVFQGGVGTDWQIQGHDFAFG